ncbi:MAG: S-layer family protein, partial [Rivularia sp. (in: cyanobacteria)]
QLLIINVPLGLQYGNNPAPIELQQANLNIKPNQVLGLIGGNISLDNSSLTVPGGTVELAGLSSAGTVNFNDLKSLTFSENTKFNDISITNQSSINVAAAENGNIFINANDFTLNNSNFRAGIKATESIKLQGTANGIPSRLLAQVDDTGSGEGGNIVLETQELTLTDGAQISAGNLGTGKGGNINILAGDTVNIDGFAPVVNSLDIKVIGIIEDKTGSFYPSGIFSSSPGIGDAGNLNIETSNFNLKNNAQVSVSSQQEGAAGNLSILATKKALFNNGILNADTVAGNQANISLNSPNIQLRYGSSITTNATQTATGGNINIDTLTLVALENSDITANAEESFGGKIAITAEGIFGTQFREFLTSESDITASSELGAEFNGVVEINTIATDPNSGLVQLPTGLADSSQKIASGCSKNQTGNFTVTGRGGLPESPNQLFAVNNPMVDLVDVVSASANQKTSVSAVSSTSSTNHIRKEIVEAQGWIVDAEGNVEFVAEVPEVTPNSGGISQAYCQSNI